MGKDKLLVSQDHFAGMSIGQSACAIGTQILSDVLEEPQPEKINWDNVRVLIASFLKTFGPIITPLVIGWLTPKVTE
jgi:hypothetical protein